MKDKNELIYRIRQIIGDEKEDGFYTSVKYNDNIIQVPNFLFKDGPAEYPEIRISPFLSDTAKAHPIRITSYGRNIKRKFYDAIFQIDIYAKSIIEAHNIYDELANRIYDFFNLETLVYSWTPQFEEIDMHIYKNIAYGIPDNEDQRLFKDIYGVKIGNTKFQRKFAYEDLELDCFYVDEDALYVCTKKNLKKIQIKVLLQGRLFQNGDAYSDRGLHYHELSDQRNLSALEDNDVERISFDLMIILL